MGIRSDMVGLVGSSSQQRNPILDSVVPSTRTSIAPSHSAPPRSQKLLRPSLSVGSLRRGSSPSVTSTPTLLHAGRHVTPHDRQRSKEVDRHLVAPHPRGSSRCRQPLAALSRMKPTNRGTPELSAVGASKPLRCATTLSSQKVTKKADGASASQKTEESTCLIGKDVTPAFQIGKLSERKAASGRLVRGRLKGEPK
eukprot:TRINITY_DN18241_c0_g1_i1.p1 TRINITY_DN18241_c0_g1~~TRINITY_DN18241_c0_g1_i1.p1  ORF type:complete len:231 (-),score=12.19 TRINITY_DN18241_c0_g1_i1:24-614(-)